MNAILFDCFGVLITDALESMVAELRVSNPSAADQVVSVVVAANKGQIDADLARNEVASIFGISMADHKAAIRSGEVKNHDLMQYILELKQSYKIGLLSNIGASGLQVRFSKEELDSHFDTVVASGEVGLAKPEVAVYQLTADRLGVRTDECIMVDDREDYCDGARAAGMTAILYTSLPQLKAELVRLL